MASRLRSDRAPGARAFLLGLWAMLLAGCAAVPQTIPQNGALTRAALEFFTLEARFSLRHEERSYSGLLSWRHAPGRDAMFLASPLGQGIAEIVSDAGGVRLTGSDGKVYAAADATTLTQGVLGFPLPLERLSAWVLGRNVADAGHLALDDLGRPLRLVQDGWLIAYEYADDDPQALPMGLRVERQNELELRMRIDEWGRADE